MQARLRREGRPHYARSAGRPSTNDSWAGSFRLDRHLEGPVPVALCAVHGKGASKWARRPRSRGHYLLIFRQSGFCPAWTRTFRRLFCCGKLWCAGEEASDPSARTVARSARASRPKSKSGRPRRLPQRPLAWRADEAGKRSGPPCRRGASVPQIGPADRDAPCPRRSGRSTPRSWRKSGGSWGRNNGL